MRLHRWFLLFCLAITGAAEETVNHRFNPYGAHQPEGFPEDTPKILAVAERPVNLHFSSMPVDWQPVVHIYRVTAARRIALPSVEAEFTANSWRITWTPPETRSPAQYEIRLAGEPERVIRVETRDPKWIAAILKAFSTVEWEANGLTAKEEEALATIGIQPSSNKAATATFEMSPPQDDASRRRIVWDEKNPYLLVWRTGPSSGDLAARAPRWSISPEALATDHGLIRFLDLFSEPPLKP